MDSGNDKRSDSLRSFLSDLNHEIRTPMNTILGSAEIIMHEPISKKAYNSICDIKASAEHVMQLAGDIFDFGRILVGDFSVSCDEYCFNDLCQELSVYLEQKTEEKKLKFKLDIDNELPFRVSGDSVRLRQMVMKLINNAVNFTKTGAVGLSVKKISADGNKVFIRFDVSDNGTGILDDDMVQVLSGKNVLEHKNKRLFEGAAMGVYLTKMLASYMGGKLTVKSIRNVGCTFTLLIEQSAIGVATLEDDIYTEQNRNDVAISFSAPGARVLIVDDNLLNAKVEYGLLRSYLIDADIADNGASALDLIQRIHYDLIFMDHMMPDMDGVDITRTIRKMISNSVNDSQYFEKLPIIALTANADIGAMDMLIDYGMNDYISKPVNINELERVLRTWLPADIVKYTADFGNTGKGLTALESLGLSTKLALLNFEGNETEYRNVLISLCRSGNAKGRLIMYYLEQRDYKNYIIAMRGMIGVAQVIGAVWLADKAKELERVAKQGNREYLIKETRLMIDYLDKLIMSIDTVIVPKNEGIIKGEIGFEDLKCILRDLIITLEEYQIDNAEEMFYKLGQMTYEDEKITEELHKAEEYMMSYQYNEAVEQLKMTEQELINKLNS